MAVNKVSFIEQKQKIEIGIIGGPFDRITTVLEEFEPGQKNFIVYPEQCGVAPRKVAEVAEREVEVTVPARLHPTVLDMNRFNVSRPGGGGMGIAVGVYLKARVRSTPGPEIVVKGERPLIATHFARVFREILGYKGGFEIELYDHKRRHVGMGSSTGTMCAACIGINEVLGRPFNNRELRRILGYNACEESPRGSRYLIRGFETGMGAMVSIHGGMVLGTDDMEIIYRTALPGTRAIIVIPDVPSLKDEFTGKDTAAESEVELLMRRARYLDYLQCGTKSQIVLLDLLPAMVRGDLKGIGDAMFDLCFLGSKRAECEQHGVWGTHIYNFIGSFRELGAEVAGMSSVGPTVFALTRSGQVQERIMDFLASRQVAPSRIIVTEVDNIGARILENGKERNYQHEGWLSG
ncbi:predicted archaeal sugar kinases [Pelotomaculum thermopropionicum SI]|uniref:Predicted archaeal sugar kinases n=1 Tax=Pelotomaculum thermopropionicum (strain DSM 13744 / JCM 10971 / SI) TaxID=370438 RepID=A5D4L9_PELTS|nr:predicted archaeal sugar kinases [Pelotomaculum thermopropionicum SI]